MTDNDESGVIDITNLAESMRQSFVLWASTFIYTEAVAEMPWLGLPIINVIVKTCINAALNILTTSAVMGAFFINTSIRKATQAQDYVDALNAKKNLPANASAADFEKAEQDEINAFNSFVVLGN